VGSGSSTSGLVIVLYGVDATSPIFSLGIPLICTSDMDWRDRPRELPSWWQRNSRLHVALYSVMISSVYENGVWHRNSRGKDRAEFMAASHVPAGAVGR